MLNVEPSLAYSKDCSTRQQQSGGQEHLASAKSTLSSARLLELVYDTESGQQA